MIYLFLTFGVICVSYLLSYYAGSRKLSRLPDGRRTFILEYEWIPNKRAADALRFIHTPLRLIDRCVYLETVAVHNKDPELLIEVPNFSDCDDEQKDRVAH